VYYIGKIGDKSYLFKNGQQQYEVCAYIFDLQVVDGQMYYIGKVGNKWYVFKNGKKQSFGCDCVGNLNVVNGIVYYQLKIEGKWQSFILINDKVLTLSKNLSLSILSYLSQLKFSPLTSEEEKFVQEQTEGKVYFKNKNRRNQYILNLLLADKTVLREADIFKNKSVQVGLTVLGNRFVEYIKDGYINIEWLKSIEGKYKDKDEYWWDGFWQFYAELGYLVKDKKTFQNMIRTWELIYARDKELARDILEKIRGEWREYFRDSYKGEIPEYVKPYVDFFRSGGNVFLRT
jgi:hypothetical protein